MADGHGDSSITDTIVACDVVSGESESDDGEIKLVNDDADDFTTPDSDHRLKDDGGDAAASVHGWAEVRARNSAPSKSKGHGLTLLSETDVLATQKSSSLSLLSSGFRRVFVATAWLVLWQLAAYIVHSQLLLPGPIAVCLRVAELGISLEFWASVVTTLTRVAAGFMLAFALGLLLGAASVRWQIVADALRPPLAVLKATPIVCVIVLLLMWASSRGVPIIASFVVAFPPTYFATLEGLNNRDERMGELFEVFRSRASIRLCAHVWPEIVPYLSAASETSCSMALKAGVAAELIGSPLGSVGERIYQAKLLLETTDVLAWTLVVVVLASISSHAMVAALRRSAKLFERIAVSIAARHGRSLTPSPVALHCEATTLAYGSHTIVSRLTHTFAAGSRTVLTDASGAGKTTLILAFAGLLQPVEGAIHTAPASIVFQDPRLVEDLSAVDNVVLLSGVEPDEAAAALVQVLPGVDLMLPVSKLSGGQRRRVELVRSLLASSCAVLLDEPFAALDDGARSVCGRFVIDYLAGRTLIVASHASQEAHLLHADTLSIQSTL